MSCQIALLDSQFVKYGVSVTHVGIKLRPQFESGTLITILLLLLLTFLRRHSQELFVSFIASVPEYQRRILFDLRFLSEW